MDDSDVELVLNTLFEIRTDVRYLIDILDGDEDDDAGEEEEG